MEYSRISTKTKIAWRITSTISFFSWLFFIFFVDVIILGNEFLSDNLMALMFAIQAFFLIFMFLRIIVFPILKYKSWRYLIEEDRVIIKNGIVFKSTFVIPVIRIQHLSMKQGPIYRKLGIYNIEISMTSDTHIIIGLSKSEAETLVENLRNKVKEYIVSNEKSRSEGYGE